SAVASLASAPKGVVVREARRAEATGAEGLIQPWTASRTQTHAKQNTHHQQQNTNTKKADPKSAHQQSITQERLSDLPPESESPHHPLLRAPTSPHNTKHEGAPTP